MKRGSKALISLWYFKNKDSSHFQNLKFYSATRALKTLDRNIPREETDLVITKFKVEDIISIREVNTAYYAYCPLRSNNTPCLDCSFVKGLGVDISSVIPKAIFDKKFLRFFIYTNVSRRVTFNCNRHIDPKFIESEKPQYVNQQKLLAEITPNTSNIKVYCWVPPHSTLEGLKTLYANQTFKMHFRVTTLEGNEKVMIGSFTDAITLTNIHAKELDIILDQYMNPTQKESALIIFNARMRIRRGDLDSLKIKATTKLLRELEWTGFISKSNGMFYRRRKLGNALKCS